MGEEGSSQGRDAGDEEGSSAGRVGGDEESSSNRDAILYFCNGLEYEFNLELFCNNLECNVSNYRTDGSGNLEITETHVSRG